MFADIQYFPKCTIFILVFNYQTFQSTFFKTHRQDFHLSPFLAALGLTGTDKDAYY